MSEDKNPAAVKIGLYSVAQCVRTESDLPNNHQRKNQIYIVCTSRRPKSVLKIL